MTRSELLFNVLENPFVIYHMAHLTSEMVFYFHIQINHHLRLHLSHIEQLNPQHQIVEQ